MKRSNSPFVHIGTISLLVIFITLIFVTFAMLSLSTAQSDYSFSQKLAERRTAYYESHNQEELGGVSYENH